MIRFIFLGLVQGITEFFPVSSSGHLVILQHILKIKENVVFLDVVLHLGTLCSLVVFFRRDIFVLCSNIFTAFLDIVFRRRIFYVWRHDDKFRLCVYILVMTLVTGFIVKSGRGFFERQFESINTVIISLFIMSLILFLTKGLDYGQRYLRHISLKDSILLGLVQSIAVIPGISRSGITISLLLFLNTDRESAFKFSFLASIPIILLAFIVKFKEMQGIVREIPMLYLASGFLFAFISGLVALYLVNLILKRKSFYKFSYYCFLLSIIVLLLKIRNIL